MLILKEDSRLNNSCSTNNYSSLNREYLNFLYYFYLEKI